MVVAQKFKKHDKLDNQLDMYIYFIFLEIDILKIFPGSYEKKTSFKCGRANMTWAEPAVDSKHCHPFVTGQLSKKSHHNLVS